MTNTHNHATKKPWWFAIASKPWSPVAFLLAVLILTILWQAFSPFTLIEDEAHYWEWSRRLDWSYYSKGPGVALLIRASTSILGTSELAIRLPAAIALFFTGLACVRMTKELFNDRIITFIAAILTIGVPGLAFSSMLMTIDAPYLACWAWASFFASRAILRSRNTDWIYFGLILALGFVMKYTILLLIPGVLLAIFLTRNKRPQIKPLWFTLGTALILLGLVPVLVWNAQHDWATMRHLLGHLGVHGGDTENTLAGPGEPYTILWTFEYLALLALVGGGVLSLGILGWINTKKHADPTTQTAATTLFAFALPVLAFYLLVSFKAQVEGNWPMSAFVTFVPISAWAVKDALARNDRPLRFVWGVACGSIIAVYSFFPLASWLAARPLVGSVIPIERITGMRQHANAVQSALDQLRERTGLEPFVITAHYGRASLLAYYLDGQPTVYCNSALTGGRKTQYDLWDQTDLTNPDTLAQLAGRPAILMGGTKRMWSFAFDQVTDIGKLDSEPKEHNTTFTGLNFTDFNSWISRRQAGKTP